MGAKIFVHDFVQIWGTGVWLYVVIEEYSNWPELARGYVVS